MNWKDIWMTLFGTVDLFGLDMGFWVSMAVVALIVVVMNAVFWGMSPVRKRPAKPSAPDATRKKLFLSKCHRESDGFCFCAKRTSDTEIQSQ